MKTDVKHVARDQMIPLRQLRFGHDPAAGPEINARSTGRLDRIPEMVAMLRTQGQIYPLLVIENPTGEKKTAGEFFVFGGNRRLAALFEIHGGSESTHEVPCKVYPPGTPAFELSLAENNTLPLHPVERFRGFAEIIRREGIAAAEQAEVIAHRFGLTLVEARKSLALGALADEVMDAWVKGDIGAEHAQVFTLTDKAHQVKLLASGLKDRYALQTHNLRRAIMGKKEDVAKYVAFVGPDAYRAAGGTMTEDLFGSHHVVHDAALAKKLADDKITEVCAALVADGWAWAIPTSEAPQNWRHGLGWGQLEQPKMPKLTGGEADMHAQLKAAVQKADDADDYDKQDQARSALAVFESSVRMRAYKPADKAKSGCIVGIDDDGELDIDAGVQKPEEKKAEQKAERQKKVKAGGGTPTIPAALASDLSIQFTKSVADVVVGGDPIMVLRLAVAGLAAGSGFGIHDCPIKLKHEGMGSTEDMMNDTELADVLKSLPRSEAALIGKLSRFVSMAISAIDSQPGRSLTDKDEHPELVALVSELPVKPFQLALRQNFDAQAYFTRAPGAFALAALADMGVEPLKGAKKSELATLAADHAKKTGWLPVELRAAGYAGPVAKSKAVKPAAVKKPAKKKRT